MDKNTPSAAKGSDATCRNRKVETPPPSAHASLLVAEKLTTTRRHLRETAQKGHGNDGSDAPKLKQ